MQPANGEQRKTPRQAGRRGAPLPSSSQDRDVLARLKDEILRDQAHEAEATQAVLRQGRNLAEIRARRLYLLDGAARFYDWARDHLGYESNQTRKYLRVAREIRPEEVAGRRLSLNTLELLCRVPRTERARLLDGLGPRVTARALRQALARPGPAGANLQDCLAQLERQLARLGRLAVAVQARLVAGEPGDAAILDRLRRQAEALAALPAPALTAPGPAPKPLCDRPDSADAADAALAALRDPEEVRPARRAHAPLPPAPAPARRSGLRVLGSLAADLDENTLAALAQEGEPGPAPAPAAEPPPAPAEGAEYTPAPAPPGPVRERPPRFADPDYPYPILKTAAVCGEGDLSSFGLLGLRYRRWEPLGLSYAAPFALGLFGVPGSGKSYALGALIEGGLQPLRCLNHLRQPLCAVSLHYHPAASYEPELLAAAHENPDDKDAEVLLYVYRALPAGLRDVLVLTLPERVAEMRARHPHVQVHPIRFALRELGTDGLRILLGLAEEPAPHYAQQVEQLLREMGGVLTWNRLIEAVRGLPCERRVRRLLLERLQRVRPWIDDRHELRDFLRPGRLIQVDLRGEWVAAEQAMTLFALCVRSLALQADGQGRPPLLLAYDEAHKFARVPLLRRQMETLVRERRHLGVSVVLASQDPPSVPQEVLSLLDGVGLFRHESAAWARHLGRANAAFARLPVRATAALPPGLMWYWARRWQAVRPGWEPPDGPILVATRPRASRHGG